MNAKIPILATNVSGTREVIINDETGKLVRPGNSAELVDGMVELLTNREKAKVMADRVYDRVITEFSSSNMANTYLGVFTTGLSEEKM